MPAVRVRKGRVALTLASISVLLLILISSGHVWNTSRDEKYPDLKAYASSLRNRYPGWTSKDEDTFRKTSDYPQEQLSGSGTDRGPDGYVDTEEEDDEDFGVRYPNGKLEPVPHDGLTDSHAVGLPGHHVGLPTGKGSAEAGAALLLDEKPGSPAEDASVKEQPKNKDDTEQMSTTSTSTTTSTPSKIHWTQFPEHYPVPTESLITLPPGTPKKMPKIQHTFGVESAEDKLDRENKLTIIKAAFNRTWSAYREYAWTHDELAPVQAASENSKYAFRDPFGGWGATLVDSLDTLWLMGMTEEFDEAVEATMSIDFTTVAREDIPIFETTIRYVGGLIGAYDLSGRKELITKCVELAGIIMAAFDTPNRMPNLYYHWKPQFASVPRRASSSVCLAEMGSLSLEFTRLAQITGDQKYYDAIARITDNFEDFQNRTSVPGLWPLSFDASGCANPWTQQEMQKNGLVNPRKDESSFGADSETDTKSKPASAVGPDARKDQSSFGDDSSASNIERRQVRQEGATTVTGAGLGDIDSSSTDRSVFVAQIEEKMAAMPTKKYPKPISSCLPFDGFQSVQRDEYALGGRADSTYEYLPKVCPD
jgi:mannosyl-oligosaccharide alpha-1,2-mannosidase